ncbi:c-type cytochrome [Tahibacter amnicola]|uniref:C-type cytochrome n=1 Tax=Tahibacter amnicola TaxID=2976241 RepID=A0ABY6BID3_9GAMM|nr:c-type cytochrome [Tahibacter amnicola]UXI68855.1 c-type cytochrome [Tahibacter amnicola]
MRPIFLVALAVFGTCAATAQADEVPRPARLGLCASCHGEDGRSTQSGTPHLAGQDLEYLKTALAAYRSGQRDVAVMRAAVGALTPSELDALAAWYAARPPRP